MTTLVPAGITPATSAEDLLTHLLSMSQNVTHETVLKAIEALPSSAETNKIGALAVSASMSVKRVVDSVTLQAGINLPDEWKVNGTVNMSMLAMTGHLMFLLSDSELTKAGRTAKAVYRKSIGMSKDILDFGTGGTIPAKPKRSEILREWSTRLENVELTKVYRVMSAKFPLLVDAGVIAGSVSLVFAPLAGVFSWISYFWEWILVPFFGSRRLFTTVFLVLSLRLPIARVPINSAISVGSRMSTLTMLGTRSMMEMNEVSKDVLEAYDGLLGDPAVADYLDWVDAKLWGWRLWYKSGVIYYFSDMQSDLREWYDELPSLEGLDTNAEDLYEPGVALSMDEDVNEDTLPIERGADFGNSPLSPETVEEEKPDIPLETHSEGPRETEEGIAIGGPSESGSDEASSNYLDGREMLDVDYEENPYPEL